MATPVPIDEQLKVVEAMASASSGRQDMLAGVLIETGETVKEINDRLEVSHRDRQAWQNITDMRLDHLEEDVLEVKSGIAKLNNQHEGLNNKVGGLSKKVGDLSKKVGDLNTKYERLDTKVDALGRSYKALDGKVNVLSGKVGELDTKVGELDKKVDALDGKVGLLTEEVGGLKAGQIELRDMVATLLARSEGVGNPN